MADGRMLGVRACVFDAYGTLFDVHSAVARHSERLGPQAASISATWRQKQLEYSWLRALMGAYADFWTLTGEALDVALERHGVDDPALRERLLDAYLELDAYPEVAEVLGALARDGRLLAILSNGTPEMLRRAVDNAGLAERFRAVISVDELQTYKPKAEIYALACRYLEVTAPEICFLSSNAWDAHGAACFGFRVVWINRFDQPRERLPGALVTTIRRLDELQALLGAG